MCVDILVIILKRWLSFEDIVTKGNENSVNEVLYGTMNIEDSGHMIYYYWS